MSITVKEEAISPDKAVEYLELRNAKQRHYDPNYSRFLAAEMVAKNWKVNGESIKFSDENHLLDGQHRLHAVYIARMTVPFLVARGLPEDVFDSLDQGKKRSVASVLGMNGEQHYSALAATVGLVQASELVVAHKVPPNRLLTHRFSPIEAQRFLQANGGLRKSVDIASKCTAIRLIHPSMVACVHWLYRQKPIADTFAHGMKEGFHPTYKDQHSLHLFREAMVNNKISHAKMRRPMILALAIIAMNASIAGEKLKELSWHKDDKFPVPLKP